MKGTMNITHDITDTLIERPLGFKYRCRHYCIYPLSLGKIQMITRVAENLGLVDGVKSSEIASTINGSALEQRKECLRILAYATLKGDECLDEGKVAKRMRRFRWMDTDCIASLLAYIVSYDKSGKILEELRIDKENEKMNRVAKSKKNQNTLFFGGKSVWGTLIDFACERYGWTMHYVVWGISYSNLQILLADHVKSIYLTDEERKNARVSTDGVSINASDADTLALAIQNTNWR